MRSSIAWGQRALELEIADANCIAGRRADAAPNLADPAKALGEALEHPLDYPSLRQALTPDDHVAIVIDEGIPGLVKLLVPLLEHLGRGGVSPDAITIVCPAPSSGQAWLDDLPDEFQDLHIEVHQPADRKKLAYLATTKDERRVYLNRTAVDADQLVVMTRRRHDPVFGYSGGETAVYPGLADQATLEQMRNRLASQALDMAPWPIQVEAREVVWLSGAPFFVQIIEGAGGGIAHVLAGPLEASEAGQRLVDARWRVEFDQAADVVIAGVSVHAGGMENLARAAFAAARIVKPGGSVVLLADYAPELGPAFEMFRKVEDVDTALPLLAQEKPSDLMDGYLWALAASQARLYLLSGLTDEVAEEIFAVPLQHAEQAQRLLARKAACVLLSDAEKTLAILA